MAYLTHDNPELLAAWQHFPDPVLAHPTGEVLEYMGSTKTADGWVHTFRHRCHPKTGERRYWHLPATPGWAPSTAEEYADDHSRRTDRRSAARVGATSAMLPGGGKQGRLSQEDASRQILLMREIVRTLMRLDAEQRQLSLFAAQG
jgi:hypothetical protein